MTSVFTGLVSHSSDYDWSICGECVDSLFGFSKCLSHAFISVGGAAGNVVKPFVSPIVRGCGCVHTHTCVNTCLHE